MDHASKVDDAAESLYCRIYDCTVDDPEGGKEAAKHAMYKILVKGSVLPEDEDVSNVEILLRRQLYCAVVKNFKLLMLDVLCLEGDGNDLLWTV
jgi:hypothetical protein